MKKSQIIFIAIALLIVVAIWLQFKPSQNISVTNFEECVAVEGIVMESYPRQCRHGDKTFVEVITETFTQTNGPVNYSIDLPFGWYPYENGQSVIFTQNPNLEIPQNTDGFAIGPNFYILVNNITDIEGVASYDEWLDKNGLTDKNELFISRENVNVNGLEMIKVRHEAAGVAGEVMTYIYFADIQRVITLSQFPYDMESNITQVFEVAVQTFRVPEIQGGGGILPFKSGVTGKVLLGPICPVMMDPPDPDCADKPYQTTVQVIAIGSPKSSPFTTVESDKEGVFRLMLPPGEYGLPAVGNFPFPTCEMKNISIEPDVMLETDLPCDTGIR